MWSLEEESAKSLQLCLNLWDPVDCSPPGSSVHEILQARILEWVENLVCYSCWVTLAKLFCQVLILKEVKVSLREGFYLGTYGVNAASGGLVGRVQSACSALGKPSLPTTPASTCFPSQQGWFLNCQTTWSHWEVTRTGGFPFGLWCQSWSVCLGEREKVRTFSMSYSRCEVYFIIETMSG